MIPDVLEAVEKAKKSKLLVIVEGKKDFLSLKDLGFDIKNIFILKQKKTIQEVIEDIISLLKERNQKSCIILTDFDHEGKKLYRNITREVCKNGITINNQLRLALLKNKVSHIEGLRNYINHTYDLC